MKKIISSIIAIALLANVATVGAFANENLQKSTPANSYVKVVDKSDLEQTDEPISENDDVSIEEDDGVEGTFNGFKYVVKDDKATIKEYIGEDKVMVIPDKMDDKYPVVGIEPGFEMSQEVYSISVGESNEYLSVQDGVLFNKDKTILLRYPIGNTDERYEIPNDVKEINERAFSGATNILGVELPLKLETIGEYAFSNCTSLIRLDYEYMQNDPINISEEAKSTVLKVIPEGMCMGCASLSFFEVPKSVELIERYAFANCSQEHFGLFFEDDSNVELMVNILAGCKDAVVHCHKDTNVEKYANDFGIFTVLMGSVIYGDLNGDDEVNLQDVVELQKYLAELVKLGEDALKSSDVNLDNKLNLEDVTTMQRYIAYLIPQLPYNSEISSEIDKENGDTSDDTFDFKLESTRNLLRSLLDTIESEIDVEGDMYYTEESYKLFKENYNRVKSYSNAYDQEGYVDYDNNQLLSLYAQLKISYDYLELTKLGELRSLIDIVSHSDEYFNPTNELTGQPMFTEEAVENLKKCLFKAFDVYNASKNGEYDEDEIYKTISELEDAFYDMDYDSHTSLCILLEDFSSDIENADLYTEESFQLFSDTYKKAKDLLNSDEILTDEEYDAMWEELFDVYLKLELNAKGRISNIYEMFTYGDGDFCHSFYTDESLETLKELCTNDYYNMAQLTDEQIEELADKMDEAFENLEFSPFYLALDMVYVGRDILESKDHYTEESISVLETSYNALYDVVLNPGKCSDEAVSMLIENMNICLENLEESSFGTIDMYYQSLLMFKYLEEFEIDMYTKDYIDKVNTLIEKIEAYRDDPSSISKEDEKKLADELEEILFSDEYTPYGNLYNTFTAYSMYVSDGNEFGFYTEESFKELCDLLEKASEMISDYKNYTDEQFTEIDEKLLEAFDNLEITVIGTLTQLYHTGNMLVEMNQIDPICVEESLNMLITVLEEAEKYVVGESDITDEKASELVEKLEVAMNEVEFTMEYALAIAQEFIDSVEEYYEIMKEGNFTEWVEAFDRLKELINDPDKATSKEIVELVDLLFSLIQDFEVLENLTDYTPDKAIVELNKLDL